MCKTTPKKTQVKPGWEYRHQERRSYRRVSMTHFTPHPRCKPWFRTAIAAIKSRELFWNLRPAEQASLVDWKIYNQHADSPLVGI